MRKTALARPQPALMCIATLSASHVSLAALSKARPERQSSISADCFCRVLAAVGARVMRGAVSKPW